MACFSRSRFTAKTQEEEPPIEALRVWASMRELRLVRYIHGVTALGAWCLAGRLAATKDVDLKNKAQADFYRDERKRCSNATCQHALAWCGAWRVQVLQLQGSMQAVTARPRCLCALHQGVLVIARLAIACSFRSVRSSGCADCV